jgi:uncharacterized protein (TIGR02453 family)
MIRKAMATTRATARASGTAQFTPGLFRFLRELRSHNDRDWFAANKHRYESEVREPMLCFISDFAERLAGISAHFDADPRPVGGSMFRIHRDTRFSNDKRPYKTAAAAHFRHRDGRRDVHAPGFYLHLEPGASMGGGGLWHPDAEALAKVRGRIVSHPREWKSVIKTGIEIGGDALKRPPAGYDPGHPFIEDLKRKDLYTMTRFTDGEVAAPDFLARYADACRRAAPLVSFLARALGMPW